MIGPTFWENYDYEDGSHHATLLGSRRPAPLTRCQTVIQADAYPSYQADLYPAHMPAPRGFKHKDHAGGIPAWSMLFSFVVREVGGVLCVFFGIASIEE